ncbi:MAG: hypothetical protein Q8934_08855 [Bacillota bacterium]|nr:hypothetical protein [Bacillota bacterium]
MDVEELIEILQTIKDKSKLIVLSIDNERALHFKINEYSNDNFIFLEG